MTATQFLNKVNAVIINPLIVLVFAVALLTFFWGLFEFISSAESSASRDTGKRKILYGLIGMFIMFSAYGLINLVLGTFGLSAPEYIR